MNQTYSVALQFSFWVSDLCLLCHFGKIFSCKFYLLPRLKRSKIGNFMVDNSYLVTITVCFRSEGKLLDLLQSMTILTNLEDLQPIF